jgi:release factor glutamine methyltransferase
MTSSIGELLDSLTQQFSAVSDSARVDAEVLLSFVAQKNRTWLYTWPERELSEPQNQQLQILIERRLQGEPVAYLTGQREFWSLTLQVSPDTLIPRPDTELLVEVALELLADRSREHLNIVDLGTGTGAIALAIASEQPNWQVVGLDRIPAAVALAQRNQSRLQISNASFLESDWFSAIDKQQFDLIVSNPPYIESQDPHLEAGDVRFEPRSALVAEDDGLLDIKKIIAQAPEYLVERGWILFEHGYQQAEAVRNLLSERGFVAVQTRCDLAGHERATLGQWLGD